MGNFKLIRRNNGKDELYSQSFRKKVEEVEETSSPDDQSCNRVLDDVQKQFEELN
jgi:hypothetical protein